MSDKPKDAPKDPFEGKNPTDPKGLNPPKVAPRSTDTEPPTVNVTFSKPCLSYNIGETAAFSPEAAKDLADQGVTEGGGAPKRDAPHPPAAAHDTKARR